MALQLPDRELKDRGLGTKGQLGQQRDLCCSSARCHTTLPQVLLPASYQSLHRLHVHHSSPEYHCVAGLFSDSSGPGSMNCTLFTNDQGVARSHGGPNGGSTFFLTWSTWVAMVISTWWVKGKFGLYLAAGTEWPPLGVFSLVHEFLMMVFSSHLMLKCKVSDPYSLGSSYLEATLSLWLFSGPFITSHSLSRGFRNSKSLALHRCVFKRPGNYLWSIFLNPFSSPAALPPTHILRRAGKLSQPTWTSQCLTTHYCPSAEDKSAGPLFKDMGNIPNFPTLPPLFWKDIHSYLAGNVCSIIYSHFLASMTFSFPVLSLLLEDKPYSLDCNDRGGTEIGENWLIGRENTLEDIVYW